MRPRSRAPSVEGVAAGQLSRVRPQAVSLVCVNGMVVDAEEPGHRPIEIGGGGDGAVPALDATATRAQLKLYANFSLKDGTGLCRC